MSAAANFAASPAAVSWARACSSLTGSGCEELSAAAPMIAISATRAAPAVIAT
jgi:hypothetical protein